MKCPQCGADDDRVVNSRSVYDGTTIRRRRECLACNSRFTTRETLEVLEFQVVKKDLRRESFSREKILKGLAKAFEKRPFGVGTWEAITEVIELELQHRPEREITSEEIGQIIMDQLQACDEVAYIRFASVYRRFKDVSQFEEELAILKSLNKPVT